MQAVIQSKDKKAAEQIYERASKIRFERPKPLPKIIKIIVLDKVAKKIGELQTPDETIVELFTVEGYDKIFAHGAQLALAAGYSNQSGATSDNSDFSKAVNAVARFYGLRRNKGGKVTRFVDVKEVPAVLEEFAFNRTYDKERYDTVATLLDWWLQYEDIINDKYQK